MNFPDDLAHAVSNLQGLGPEDRFPTDLTVQLFTFAEERVDEVLLDDFCGLIAPHLTSLTVRRLKGFAIELVFLDRLLSRTTSRLRKLFLEGSVLSEEMGRIVTEHLSESNLEELALNFRHQYDSPNVCFQGFTTLVEDCSYLKSLHMIPLLEQRHVDIAPVFSAIGRHPTLDTLSVGTVRQGESLCALFQTLLDSENKTLKRVHMDFSDFLINFRTTKSFAWIKLLSELAHLQLAGNIALWYSYSKDASHFAGIYESLRQCVGLMTGFGIGKNGNIREDVSRLQNIGHLLQRRNQRIWQTQEVLLQQKGPLALPLSCWPRLFVKVQDYIKDDDDGDVENATIKNLSLPMDPTPTYLILQSHLVLWVNSGMHSNE